MLIDDVSSTIHQLRAAAESLMVDTCQIRRVLSVVPDPLTGEDVVTYADPDPYTGKCKVQDRDMVSSEQSIPAGTVAVGRLEVHVPVTAGPFEVGDVIEILDDETVTRVFRVTGRHEKTWQTARRLPVEELTL